MANDVGIDRKELLEIIKAESEKALQKLKGDREDYIKSTIVESIKNYDINKKGYDFDKLHDEVSDIEQKINFLMYDIKTIEEKIKKLM